MTIQIAKNIEQVKIQVEYTICHHIQGSQSNKDTDHIFVRTLPTFLHAVSKEKLEDLKEELEADEVFVSGIVVISEEAENQVITHFNLENQVTVVKTNVDNEEMSREIQNRLLAVQEQTEAFSLHIKELTDMKGKGK